MKAQKDPARYERMAEKMKALAHPVRLCIVHNLLDRGGCSVGHMQECLGVSQSLTSQHLARLKTAGILKAERKGKTIEYCVEDALAKAVVQILLEYEE
jgi:DNA-binding transcriptional ArsR family regulator